MRYYHTLFLISLASTAQSQEPAKQFLADYQDHAARLKTDIINTEYTMSAAGYSQLHDFKLVNDGKENIKSNGEGVFVAAHVNSMALIQNEDK